MKELAPTLMKITEVISNKDRMLEVIEELNKRNDPILDEASLLIQCQSISMYCAFKHDITQEEKLAAKDKEIKALHMLIDKQEAAKEVI